MNHRRPQSRTRDTSTPLASPFDTDDVQPVYASDVHVLIEPGSIQLVFTRYQPSSEPSAEVAHDQEMGESQPMSVEQVMRIILPPLAAQRLLRLLPSRLNAQQAMASAYARDTEAAGTPEPPESQSTAEVTGSFIKALATAEDDDEPYTDEDRAAASAGWEAYLRGESSPWEEIRPSLVDAEQNGDDSSLRTTS